MGIDFYVDFEGSNNHIGHWSGYGNFRKFRDKVAVAWNVTPYDFLWRDKWAAEMVELKSTKPIQWRFLTQSDSDGRFLYSELMQLKPELLNIYEHLDKDGQESVTYFLTFVDECLKIRRRLIFA